MARHLTLYDFRDLDLMSLAAESANELGEVSTEDLATALGFGEDRRSVGIRLAWMKRYGVFSFDERKHLWRLTRAGERVLEAKAQAAVTPVLEAVPDESLIDVMAHVTSRYRHGDAMTATLLRREFLFGTRPGSAAYRGNGRRGRR